MLSIANNILMYSKCYISKNLSFYDPKLKSTIKVIPINLYYVYDVYDENIINEIKSYLHKIKIKNANKFDFVIGNPTCEDYQKINQMVVVENKV